MARRKSLHSKCVTLTPAHQSLIHNVYCIEGSGTRRPRIGTSHRFRLFTGESKLNKHRRQEGIYRERLPTAKNLATHVSWRAEESTWIKDAAYHTSQTNVNELQAATSAVKLYQRGENADFNKKIIEVIREKYKKDFFFYYVPQLEFIADRSSNTLSLSKGGPKVLCLIPRSVSLALEILKDDSEADRNRILQECARAVCWIVNVMLVGKKIVSSDADRALLMGQWTQYLSDTEVRLITEKSSAWD